MDSEEKAFDEGWNASYKGYTKKHNPYKRHSVEWVQWRDGNVLGHKDDPYWIRLKTLQYKIKKKIEKENLPHRN